MKTGDGEYGLSGTEPVINQECMLVHEKVDICQFEWYRDNKVDFITVSSLWVWDGFLLHRTDRRSKDFYSGIPAPRIFSPVRQQKRTRVKENRTMMKRKVMAVLLTAAMTTAMAAGCSGSSGSSDSSGSGEDSYTIGISQFAEHGSLDNCREGFLQGLENEGIVEGENLTVEYQNAAADMGTASQISDAFVSDKVDLICAIATPTAQSAYNAAMDTDIPVVYTAVTDPVAAELADEDGNPVGNVTGTSDELPIKEQLEMIRQILPDAEKVGIMYTTSEANSISALETYKELAGDYGFEIVESGISTTADISLAADDLISKVDCITNLTDNTVVASLPTILEKANEKGIPVFGSEIEQVRIGCLAAEGLDYVALGEQTGEMAAKILKGEAQASEMPYETISEPGFYVNMKVAENLGITVPDELTQSAVESFDEISDSSAE